MQIVTKKHQIAYKNFVAIGLAYGNKSQVYMSKFKEGNLEAPTRHPLNWKDEDFYNEDSLNTDLE